MKSNRQASVDQLTRVTLTRSVAKTKEWTDHAKNGYPVKQDAAAFAGEQAPKSNDDPLTESMAGLAFAAMVSAATPERAAGQSLLQGTSIGQGVPPRPQTVDHTWRTVRGLDGSFRASQPDQAVRAEATTAKKQGDLWDALKASGTKSGLSSEQISNLVQAYVNKDNGANFLDKLASMVPKDQAHLLQSAAAYLKYKGYDQLKQAFRGDMSFAKFCESVNTTDGAAGALLMLSPFLGRQEQRFAGVAAGYLINGQEGALRGAIAFLPKKYQSFAKMAMDLALTKPSEFIKNWVGSFLPPEARAFFGAICDAEGITELLSALNIPDLPPLGDAKETDKPKESSNSSAATADGNQPFAARVEDPRRCSFGVGTIKPKGCKTVYIGGKNAARKGDFTTCISGSDEIREGEDTVLIGCSPAARAFDPTFHAGGRITDGEHTVLIGKVFTGAYSSGSGTSGPNSGSNPGPDRGGSGGDNEGDPLASAGNCLPEAASNGNGLVQ